MKLNDFQNIYLIGIKGAGMTGLAQILSQRGKNVWGSDTPDVFFTDQVLKREGIKVLSKFQTKNITKKIDLVIYSTAYNEKNIEFRTAKKKGLKMISYPQALGLLFEHQYNIAVCGTHGKTTTTAMLGYVLQELELDPTVVVGSEVEQLGGNARSGLGNYLVIEADEYQNKLKYYNPQAVILTSADFDHPDYFKNQTAYNKVFKDFVKRIPPDGVLVACWDNKNVREIARVAKCRVVKYGFKIYDLRFKNIKLQVPGEYNQLNALAVLTLIKELGLEVKKARNILEKFRGCKRRFELLGRVKGILIYDDYAHHPVEVAKVLETARKEFPKRKIWAIFQSHTYTRTKVLIKDFAKSFKEADQVIVLDIFGSAREKQGTITPQQVVKEINKYSKNATYHGKIKVVVDYLAKEVKPGDVVITIGAGENWKVGEGLIKKLEIRNQKLRQRI